MDLQTLKSSIIKGSMAVFILLAIYFSTTYLVSGSEFAQNQFKNFWYYILTLAMGFGFQVGLYNYLKNISGQKSLHRVVAVSGTTSTLVMVSCCTHYLVNFLPILATIGVVTFIAQYQVQFFWLGIIFNLLGIIYLLKKIKLAQKQ